ncbi:MAG: glycosyltransferase [bacterium]|nr:glycosyltransferase [bacterium]
MKRISARFNKQNIERGIRYLQRNGISETFYKATERLSRDEDEAGYEAWLETQLPDTEELKRQRNTEFKKRYKISILVPAYETPPVFLREMIESVIAQSYTDWELCIADGSRSDTVKNCVMDMVGRYCAEIGSCRIKYQKLDKNYGISVNSNKALEMANGDYVGLLDHDDLLAPDALFETVSILQTGLYEEGCILNNRISAVYSDEDKVDGATGRHFDHHRKPGFNLDLLRTNNYICHFFVVSSSAAKRAGGFRTEYNGAQDHDFILRCVENAPKESIAHIPKVLYHWRAHEDSTADHPESKLYAYDAGKRAIEAHLERMDIEAQVLYTPHLGFFRIKYAVGEERVAVLSRETWNAVKQNGLDQIEEEYIMIMNNSLRPVTPGWQRELLGHLVRADVGAVAGKILDRTGHIESAGYSRNEEGKLVANFKGLSGHHSGYLHRANLQQEVDGLPLDCMMIKKQALVNGSAGIAMSKDYIAVYDPYAVFRRW